MKQSLSDFNLVPCCLDGFQEVYFDKSSDEHLSGIGPMFKRVTKLL